MNSKTQILQVAEEIFYQKGYPSSSIRDIAKAARVNNAAINYYFVSKENLYLTLLKKMRQPIEIVCTKKRRENNKLLLKEFISESLQTACSQHKVFRLYLKEQSEHSSVKSESLVKRYQEMHFKRFSSLIRDFSVHKISGKRIELIYHSIFGMIKQLLQMNRVKVNEAQSSNDLFDIKAILSYIDRNYLTPDSPSFQEFPPN